MSAKRRAILGIVRTDATFERVALREGEAWVGKCIHCGSRLVIGLDGEPWGHATIEHILPRSHGGTDAPENLALACARCNHQKGVRHDAKRRRDAGLDELVRALTEKRRARWRAP